MSVHFAGDRIENGLRAGLFESSRRPFRPTADLTKRRSPAQRAIALNPRIAEAHSNLGDAMTGQERTDEAIAAYRSGDKPRIPAWAKRLPGWANCLPIRIWLAALEMYRRAGDSRSEVGRGSVWAGLGAAKTRSSRDEARDVNAEGFSDDAEGECEFGNLLLQLGRVEEASRCVQSPFGSKSLVRRSTNQPCRVTQQTVAVG